MWHSLLTAYICPAYLFTLRPEVMSQCELSLVITDFSLSPLLYTNNSISNQSTYHEQFGTTHCYYYQEKSSVTLICRDHSKPIERYYMVPDQCEVRNNDFLTLPTHHYTAFVSTLSNDLQFLNLVVNISLDKVTVVSDKVNFLYLSNDSQFTSTLDTMLPLHLS